MQARDRSVPRSKGAGRVWAHVVWIFLNAAGLPDWPGGKPELMVEYGDPDRLLYEYVMAKDIDLVAVGSHGRSAVFHALIGSIAQSLTENLPCDVLIVREPRASRTA